MAKRRQRRHGRKRPHGFEEAFRKVRKRIEAANEARELSLGERKNKSAEAVNLEPKRLISLKDES